MNVDRITVTMDAELADAAADRLRNELLGLALDAWEEEYGAFTDDELNAAAALLQNAKESHGNAA